MAAFDPVEIPSGEEDDASPFPAVTMKKRKNMKGAGAPPVLILVDDVTPQKSTPSVVPENPFSNPSLPLSSFVKNPSTFYDPGQLLMDDHPTLFWTPCAAHCIDLMLHDICKLPIITKTVKRAIALNGYIYNHPYVLNMMRTFTQQKELIRPGVTRFATVFLTLQSIHNQKNKLRRMFASEEWSTSRYHRDTKGKDAYETVMSVGFWNNIVYSLKATGPLVKVLRLVDSEKKPAMGYIYEAMDRAKEAISKSFNYNEAKYCEIWEIIDKRWNDQLHRPLHAAGYYLNPEYFYSTPRIESNEELNNGFLDTLRRLVPDEAIQYRVETELSMYRYARGVMGSPNAIRNRALWSPGITGLICLESDNESEGGSERKRLKENETTSFSVFDSSIGKDHQKDYTGFSPMGGSSNGNSRLLTETKNAFIYDNKSCSVNSGIFYESSTVDSNNEFHFSEKSDHQNAIQIIGDSPTNSVRSFNDYLSQAHNEHDKENVLFDQLGDATKQKDQETTVNVDKEKHKFSKTARKQQLKEERKIKNEQEKLKRQALKAEAAEMKKLQKEQQKWEKGKLAVNSIVANIDAKVVETGSIGGHLLTRFAEKGITYQITTNPIGRSILWKMNVPDPISQLSPIGPEVPYILLVYAAEEFCDLVNNDALIDQITSIRSRYPSYTICCLTNKLSAYINKREQSQYKNPTKSNCWRRPPVEEVVATLTTHFVRVHSRQCLDEAEVAEHIVGLSCSLATCQFRKKLTRLSVNANGSFISKSFIDKNLIKKSIWLKALSAIPKVQPRFAIAIWKKYPTMRSLLNVYMDPSKSVHEKEFLLKDLPTEGVLGQDERRVGEVCSKRVYRLLMAQSGNIFSDDVEDGADFFHC